ncbi:MAG: aryl-sulfate sulfotransferase [Candidatus Hermodarchaeota archaeon]
MRKSVKVLLVIGVVLIIIATPIILIVSDIIMKMGQPAQPFSLDDAPEYIIELKKELKEKFGNETFSWDDMPKFVNFSQYLADNSPQVQELIKGWEQIVLFDFENAPGDMWFLIGDDSMTIEFGADPPQDYGVLIDLSFETFIDIMKQDETPLSTFQKGTLNYEGPFNEVMSVAQISNIASATVMDTNIPTITHVSEFNTTVDRNELYIEGGLTLFPLMEININPDHIGEPHMSSPGVGSAIIIDNAGKIIAQLEGSSHSVHKFINSTTIMMGGQEGFMELWNYKDNTVETLPVPGGHHDIDYNLAKDTFMVIEYTSSAEVWDEKNVGYDFLSEYNRAGELVWQWDPRIYFPFNASRYLNVGTNETFRGRVDWMHANSFAWDKDNNVIYLVLRTLDTILKIDYTTKEVIWDAGRGGDFTLLNKAGEEVDLLFCHPHSLERITPDRFILYDNDLYNQSNPSTMTLKNSTGYSRYLELEIDEENRIMREVWSWVPQNHSYYLPESAGSVDRLPNGNTLGLFGDKALVLNFRDPVIITEVTKDGQIAWELQIPGVNNTYYWVHRVERFYEKPLISVHTQSIDLNEGVLWLNFSTWDIFKQEATSPGIVRIFADAQEIYQESFEFLPQWQPITLEITMNNLPSNVRVVMLIIENIDGIKNSVIIYQETGYPLQYSDVPLIIGGILFAIPLLNLLKKIRKRNTRNKIKSE